MAFLQAFYQLVINSFYNILPTICRSFCPSAACPFLLRCAPMISDALRAYMPRASQAKIERTSRRRYFISPRWHMAPGGWPRASSGSVPPPPTPVIGEPARRRSQPLPQAHRMAWRPEARYHGAASRSVDHLAGVRNPHRTLPRCAANGRFHPSAVASPQAISRPLRFCRLESARRDRTS